MNNADRRNIHAGAASPEAGMDRYVPSPDEDDGISMSRILRRSGSETLRFVPLRLSRMAMQRPEFRTTYPRSVPAVPTRSPNVWRCHGLRVPNLGENCEEFVLRSGNRAKMDAFSAVPWPLPTSASGSRRSGPGPHRSHPIRPCRA